MANFVAFIGVVTSDTGCVLLFQLNGQKKMKVASCHYQFSVKARKGSVCSLPGDEQKSQLFYRPPFFCLEFNQKQIFIIWHLLDNYLAFLFQLTLLYLSPIHYA